LLRARGHDIHITESGSLDEEAVLKPQADQAVNLFKTALTRLIGHGEYPKWSFKYKTLLIKEFARWHKKG
jgi:hypothetical protein